MPETTILIVDDEPENLAVLTKLLQPLYRVRAANSGMRAVQVAETTPRPELILLDIMMPEMDGYSVLKALKQNRTTQDIPVIFVTALSSIEDEERGLELGAVDFITKPIRPPIVLARIQMHLTLKRANDLLKDHNAFLEAEVARRMAENETIQDVGIHALAHLAETRDPETGNHLRRTQEYIAALARYLCTHPSYAEALTPHNIKLLTKSAPLHDIGKVGIPDYILLKPSRLEPAEWAIMKTHAMLGYEAILQAEQDADMPVAFLTLAKEIARWHHERWDGTGYPDGLIGEAIPLSARLMALADVFDALISRRVYKEAFTFDTAYAIILAGRGRHFDPAVVDAFVVLFDEFKHIARQHMDEELPS